MQCGVLLFSLKSVFPLSSLRSRSLASNSTFFSGPTAGVDSGVDSGVEAGVEAGMGKKPGGVKKNAGRREKKIGRRGEISPSKYEREFCHALFHAARRFFSRRVRSHVSEPESASAKSGAGPKSAS